jgi:enoyl-CoA hydratase/carnithine racemase
MNSDSILLEKVDHVATVTLNEPATLNALTYDMVVCLAEIVDDLAGDADVRAVILTGAGRGFCSGANLLGGSGEALGAGGMADCRTDVFFRPGQELLPWPLFTQALCPGLPGVSTDL